MQSHRALVLAQASPQLGPKKQGSRHAPKAKALLSTSCQLDVAEPSTHSIEWHTISSIAEEGLEEPEVRLSRRRAVLHRSRTIGLGNDIWESENGVSFAIAQVASAIHTCNGYPRALSATGSNEACFGLWSMLWQMLINASRVIRILDMLNPMQDSRSENLC